MNIDKFEFREDVVDELNRIKDKIVKNPTLASKYQHKIKSLLCIYKHWDEIEAERIRGAMGELC